MKNRKLFSMFDFSKASIAATLCAMILMSPTLAQQATDQSDAGAKENTEAKAELKSGPATACLE